MSIFYADVSLAKVLAHCEVAREEFDVKVWAPYFLLFSSFFAHSLQIGIISCCLRSVDQFLKKSTSSRYQFPICIEASMSYDELKVSHQHQKFTRGILNSAQHHSECQPSIILICFISDGVV
jgi:hypothetical protein